MSRTEVHNLVKILDALSPAYAAQDEYLSRSFQSFFQRATQAQRRRLLPEASNPHAVTARESNAESKTILALLEQIQKSNDISTEQLDILWVTDQSKLGSNPYDPHERIGHLIRDVERLQDLQALQICRIRLELLFLSHDLDRLEDAVPERMLSQGRGRKSVAIEDICRKCRLSPQKLKELTKRSHRYLLIAKRGGIGSLLALGDNLSVWEKPSADDINRVFDAVGKSHPVINDRFRSLTPASARTLVRGLQAYGWTNLELSKGKSRLMNLLGRVIDLQQLEQNQIVLLSKESLSSSSPTDTIALPTTTTHSQDPFDLLQDQNKHSCTPAATASRKKRMIICQPMQTSQLRVAPGGFSPYDSQFLVRHSGTEAEQNRDNNRELLKIRNMRSANGPDAESLPGSAPNLLPYTETACVGEKDNMSGAPLNWIQQPGHIPAMTLCSKGEIGGGCTSRLLTPKRKAKHIASGSSERHTAQENISNVSQYITVPYHLPSQVQLQEFIWVPDLSESVLCAISGDIEGLQRLFSARIASPNTKTLSRGFSLLRWALYAGTWNSATINFLLSQGACVDEESYDHVFDLVYRWRCSYRELKALERITSSPPSSILTTDWVKEQKFSKIHEAVIGRSNISLITILEATPQAVHFKDAKGRTALDWATARGQLHDMRTLIEHGSALNTMDVTGRTTVLHAVDSHNDDALRTVLNAGANPDPQVPKGLSRSSPLTAATFGGLEKMAELLLEAGAKVDVCNPEGRTAFHTAIMYNKHKVLELFISKCDLSWLDIEKLQPFVDQFADLKTRTMLEVVTVEMSTYGRRHRRPPASRLLCRTTACQQTCNINTAIPLSTAPLRSM